MNTLLRLLRHGYARSLSENRGSWIGMTTVTRALLSILDQAIVSGVRFLTAVIIERQCGVDGLGVYTLGFTVLVYLIGTQDNLVVSAYTVYANRFDGQRRREYAGSVVMQYGLLAVLTLMGLLVAGYILTLRSNLVPIGAVFFALAIVIPFELLRQLGRRIAFAHLRVHRALVMDATTSAIYVVGLLLLISSASLTPVNAYLVLAVATAPVGLGWLIFFRSKLAFSRQRLWEHTRFNWQFSMWVFASFLVSTAHLYLVYWMLGLLMGVEATGQLAICMNVALLSNPFVLGIVNLMTAWAAQGLSTGGSRQLTKIVWQAAGMMSLAMFVFSVLVTSFGDIILQTVYSHARTVPASLLIVSVMMVSVDAVSSPFESGLRALERTRVSFVIAPVTLVLTVLLAWFLMHEIGVLGAALGALAGKLTSCLWRIGAFSTCSSLACAEGT